MFLCRKRTWLTVDGLCSSEEVTDDSEDESRDNGVDRCSLLVYSGAAASCAGLGQRQSIHPASHRVGNF